MGQNNDSQKQWNEGGKGQNTRAAVFNVFQAKDPQTDAEMEQGPPYYIYIV